MTFAAATAVEQIGPGRYNAVVAEGWDIGGNANGGYLLAIASRAMLHSSGREDPVSVTAHYLRPGRPGPVTVNTEVLKSGRRFATVAGTMRDGDGNAVLGLVGTFGVLAPSAVDDGPEFVDAAPPELPPIDRCDRPSPEDGPPFRQQVDVRVHPDDAGYRIGARSGSARVRGWFALDDEPVDTIGLLQATDALPPPIFNLDLPVAWVPTVELTGHVRARPAPGPLRCAFTTRFVTGGYLEEDGEVWDASGKLVAQSRQLALLPKV